jgi:hypothetical protein
LTDQHRDTDGPLPELTPQQEEQVSRLLAEARHDEPVPADVADRLDTVLAGLTRDDPGAPGVAPVIDLAARRRRRNAAGLLAGAAAVIVAGFAIGQVIDVGSSDDAGSGGSTAVSADRGSAHSADGAGQPTSPGDDVAPSAAVPAPGQTFLRLSSQHLQQDLSAQLGRLDDGVSAQRTPAAESFAAAGCAQPSPAPKYALADLFPALYDDQPAVVALRPAADGRQRADVLTCDTGEPLASVTIPAP